MLLVHSVIIHRCLSSHVQDCHQFQNLCQDWVAAAMTKFKAPVLKAQFPVEVIEALP